jgi:hypothetical protein
MRLEWVVKFILSVISGVIIALLAVYPSLNYNDWGYLAAVPCGFALFLVLEDGERKRRAQRLAWKQAAAKREKIRAQRDLERKERELGLVPPAATGVPLTAVPFERGDPRYWGCEHAECDPAYPCQRKAPRVTPVKSGDVPPLVQLAQVAEQHRLPVPPAVAHSMEQWNAHVQELQEALAAEVQEAPEEPEYIPEGQAALDAMLLAHMRQQVRDAAPSRAGHSVPYPGTWTMNAEWAAEVRKLKKADGSLLWHPDLYTVLGYTVELGDEYGAPSLETGGTL